MCVILLVILFFLIKEMTVEFSSYNEVGSRHEMSRFSRNSLNYFVLLTFNKHALTSSFLLYNGTASLNTLHSMLVPRII